MPKKKYLSVNATLLEKGNNKYDEVEKEDE